MYLLTWVVLPVMMSYVDSGAFTFKGRLRESIWSNVQFYGISGAIGLVVVGYVAVTRGVFGADLVAFLMAAANFWGLFLVITFMGVGLVAIPRKLWRRGDLELELCRIESRAMSYKDKAYDSSLELAEVATEVRLVAMRVSHVDDLRPYVDRVLAHCPKPDTDRAATQSAVPASRIPAEITEAYLATLHNRIKRAVLKEERDRWRWHRAAHRAFFLQDAIGSRGNPRRQLESNLGPWCHWSVSRRSAAWWWHVALRPLVYRALSVAAAALSVSIIWSELTFNLAASHFSVIRYLLRSLGLSYLAIELASIVIIAYMCLCAYSSVMKLRIFNIFSLESHHHTNERSLLFCGAYLCRLMFPLCYNFLSMAGSSIDGSGGTDTTEFSQFMDRIDLVPILGEQSNRAIPILIMVPATLTFLNVHGRVAEYFSTDRAARGVRTPGDDGDDDVDDDDVGRDVELGRLSLPREEGRSLLAEARRAAERQQGVSDNWHTRRYSPSNSTYSSTTHHASGTAAVATGDMPSASTRGAREWQLGRPSLDHLRDDPAGGPGLEFPTISSASEPRLHGFGLTSRFGSASDLAGCAATAAAGTAAAGRAASRSAGNGTNNSDCSDTSNPESGSAHHPVGASSPQPAARPTGVAARFGRWLPVHPGATAPSRKPNNASRLRPSSRQSSRHNNYASDDGLSPVAPGTAGRRSADHLLHGSGRPGQLLQLLPQSPSSPGRTQNPWVDSRGPRSQARRHALSDSSVQAPADIQSLLSS
ncbi:hypothetical protein LPJ61_002813 [Coemansia biformis]|uniref:LMBR1-domain-containing protein n=1 Tax=Coemansia biformis TaxID=1286918 RepID=A0A9W8CZ92_9FUNG|nr:hypothetical protein LPJ61_002813 [Coemansia biformis]